ncbi:hypothetical protein JCM10296v2_001375 [Rhodotorula toruloides]
MPLYGSHSRNKPYALRNGLVKYPEFARAVRDLSMLHFGVKSMLNSPTTVYSSAIAQAVEPWSWQEDLVRLCTGATKVGVLLRDAEYAASIGKHLEGRPMLAYIRVSFPPTISRHLIHPILRDFAKGLGGVRCRASITSKSCQAPSNVLTEITWTSGTYNAGAAGPKEEYQEFCRGQVLPKAFFGLFPHLKRLSLKTVKDLDVEKLSILAEKSPGLEHLTLTSSYWTFTHTDFDNAHPSLSSAETSIVGVLDRFKKLRSADLGILPVTNDHVLSRKHDKNCRCGLRQYAKSRELKLLFEVCPSMEELEAEEEDLYYLRGDLDSDSDLYDSGGFPYASDGYEVDSNGVGHGRGGWFIVDGI